MKNQTAIHLKVWNRDRKNIVIDCSYGWMGQKYKVLVVKWKEETAKSSIIIDDAIKALQQLEQESFQESERINVALREEVETTRAQVRYIDSTFMLLSILIHSWSND